ncbi:dehydration-responsive element-binding protein 1A-like [Nicotiana tabacum]|uniref:Dehydration-responsive element-binding protein 1A-like n=2 Tax=Nicotiana TaxID=4085 RepID=A0A1S4BS50_TOBAC|nr:PREDICTED: dehydration-responsive element-binding protein 1A-like [Nicotiana sylvestris]XP_016491714.1 PREDICTED: dehydration-responsive element-binding protein 1A-like [Nicotiana tabacum]
MDIFGNYYFDLLIPTLSTSLLPAEILPESSTSSDNGSSGTPSYSDEEVMLASNYPKKRAGRKTFRETRHPVYRGIRRRNSNKWVCEVREPNKKSRIWLGTFPTAEMAARAHDVAAIALRGRSACLNFADSAWRLPIPASSAAKDIQKAAAEAAEAFRPLESDGENSREIIVDQAIQEVVAELPDNVLFMDEEALFCMPRLLANMAEGLMLPPPQCIDGYVMESDHADMSLWSY